MQKYRFIIWKVWISSGDLECFDCLIMVCVICMIDMYGMCHLHDWYIRYMVPTPLINPFYLSRKIYMIYFNLP